VIHRMHRSDRIAYRAAMAEFDPQGAPRIPRGDPWRPARIIGGVAMIIGPLVWLAAVTTRLLARELAEFTPEELAYFDAQTFRAPQQLALYEQNAGLVTAGYALFAAASVLLVPAIMALAAMIAPGSPVLAAIGGTLAALSLTARLYFSGVDLATFEMADAMGRAVTTQFVLDSYVDLSYGLWYVPVTVSAGSLVGSVLLAIAALRAGTFGVVRGLMLLLWGWTFMGVLKDSHWGTVVGGVALCGVLIPLGVRFLRESHGRVRNTLS
jgi:hypothetical protein